MTVSRANGASRDVLYAGVGPELTWYDVDVDGASLVRRGAVILPANVQNVSSDSIVFLVTRGIAPTATAPEKPGAIKELRFANGILANLRSVAPAGGFGFQARNIDFHPTRPWVYLVRD